MSDLFHPEVPLSYIKRVFEMMHRAPWHQYQILTKRSERLLEVSGKLNWAPQIWMPSSATKCGYIPDVVVCKRFVIMTAHIIARELKSDRSVLVHGSS